MYTKLRNVNFFTQSKSSNHSNQILPREEHQIATNLELKANEIDINVTTGEQIQKIPSYMAGFRTELHIGFLNLPLEYQV